MLTSVSSSELTHWMAYSKLEHWGETAEDWRAGMLASVIANIHRNPKRRRNPYKPSDFLPGQRRPKQTVADMKARMMLLPRAEG